MQPRLSFCFYFIQLFYLWVVAMTQSRIYSPFLLLIVVAALIFQFSLYGLGFYHVSADESARAIIAHRLTSANALEPLIWPPFYKIFVGLGLKVYGDIFILPRVLVSIAGVMTLVALVHLADLLFKDRWVNVGAAALAVFAHHRLVLSVAPMSDIFYFMFIIASSAFVLKWLEDGRRSSLLLASLCLFFAATDRYEASFFIAGLMLFLAYRLIITHDLDVVTVFMASAILMFFPLFWVVDSFIWYGSLQNIGHASEMTIAVFGPDRLRAVQAAALTRFAHDLAWNPLLLAGLAALIWRARHDGAARLWTLIYFAPLVVLSIVMVATMSFPMAAPWRISGVWTLLLTPFTSFALMRVVSCFWDGRRQRYAFAAALLVASAPFAVRSGQIMVPWVSSNRASREAGLYLKQQLARLDHGKVLIDSVDNYAFLDVLVGSNAPEAFVLNAGDDPVEVADHAPMAGAYRRDNITLMIDLYQSDRFALDRGGSALNFTTNDIRFVLARNPRYIDGLDVSPLVERVRRFGDWALYRVRPMGDL